MFNENGYDAMTGLYKSRYFADKARRTDPWHNSHEIIVKVCGGYRLMDAWQYDVWKKQK